MSFVFLNVCKTHYSPQDDFLVLMSTLTFIRHSLCSRGFSFLKSWFLILLGLVWMREAGLWGMSLIRWPLWMRQGPRQAVKFLILLYINRLCFHTLTNNFTKILFFVALISLVCVCLDTPTGFLGITWIAAKIRWNGRNNSGFLSRSAMLSVGSHLID